MCRLAFIFFFFFKALNHQRFDLVCLVCADLTSFCEARASASQLTAEAFQQHLVWHFPKALPYLLSHATERTAMAISVSRLRKLQHGKILGQAPEEAAGLVSGLTPPHATNMPHVRAPGKNQASEAKRKAHGSLSPCPDLC